MGYSYVISDLHGHYDEYLKMLEKIGLKDDDTLYVLGDVLDRGPMPMEIVFDLMERPNAVFLAGNHELMACDCLKFLQQAITEESVAAIDDVIVEKLLNWQRNGSDSTIKEFINLNDAQRREVMDFLKDGEVYEEVEAGGKEFILVHAGLGNFSPNRDIWDYELDELVWERPDYDVKYFDDRYVVTGHTPTVFIDAAANTRPGYILKANNHIAIDCGCGITGGRLGCIRLDDLAEFYVEYGEKDPADAGK